MSKYDCKTYEVESIPELIKVTKEVGMLLNCTGEYAWYRGASSDKYKLIPGFYRDGFDQNKELTVINDFVSAYINLQ